MTNDDETPPARGSALRGTPTTIRLSKEQLDGLEEVSRQSGLTKSSLISLGLNALIDHVKRTGKLLLPQKPTKRRATNGTRG